MLLNAYAAHASGSIFAYDNSSASCIVLANARIAFSNVCVKKRSLLERFPSARRSKKGHARAPDGGNQAPHVVARIFPNAAACLRLETP